MFLPLGEIRNGAFLKSEPSARRRTLREGAHFQVGTLISQTHIHILARRLHPSSASDIVRGLPSPGLPSPGLSSADGTIRCTSSAWRDDHDLDTNEVQTADFIVVLQGWPDEYAAADVRRLLLTAPLAEIICSYGPWCDADGRNRDIWPTGCRVPELLLDHRLRSMIAARSVSMRESNGIAGLHATRLPRTASRNELIEFDYLNFNNTNFPATNARRVPPGNDAPGDNDSKAPLAGLRVGIQSSDIAFRDFLSAVVRDSGGDAIAMNFDAETSRVESLQAVDCILVDIDTTPASATTIDNVRKTLHPGTYQHFPLGIRQIALTSQTCPRYAHAVVETAGYDACLWKLTPVGQIIAALREPITAR